MELKEKYMARCLQLATNGKGFVSPNPMVGSVIVCGNKIIGEGYHRLHGGSHAEVFAIESVADQKLLKESTLYVNLEPCSHFGKTPPCAELIIRKEIPRVVVGMKDPFPEVSGRGIKMLRDAGISVDTGVMEDECKALNKRFLTFHQFRRPYVFLKWAQSSDGFIDQLRTPGDGRQAVRFSSEYTQMLVHKMRAEEAAIMIGHNTEVLDKPRLTVRCWDGTNPIKVISDSKKTLSDQMKELYERGIQSVIVEGGSKLLNSFIREDLWDEAKVEISDLILGKGVPAPVLSQTLESVQKCKKSVILHYQNRIND